MRRLFLILCFFVNIVLVSRNKNDCISCLYTFLFICWSFGKHCWYKKVRIHESTVACDWAGAVMPEKKQHFGHFGHFGQLKNHSKAQKSTKKWSDLWHYDIMTLWHYGHYGHFEHFWLSFNTWKSKKWSKTA